MSPGCGGRFPPDGPDPVTYAPCVDGCRAGYLEAAAAAAAAAKEVDMRARDVMSRPVYPVRPDTPLEHVAVLLSERGFAAAPVVTDYGRLVGIVSEGDLLRRRVDRAGGRVPHLAGAGGPEPVVYLRPEGQVGQARPHRAADVMTSTVVSVGPETDVAEVAELMLDHHIRSLPVVERGEVVGMVSRRDVLQTVIRDDDVLGVEVQLRLDQYAGEVRRWTATVTDGVVHVAGVFDDEVERQIVMVLVRTVPGVVDSRTG